jgi:hypothetical protein
MSKNDNKIPDALKNPPTAVGGSTPEVDLSDLADDEHVEKTPGVTVVTQTAAADAPKAASVAVVESPAPVARPFGCSDWKPGAKNDNVVVAVPRGRVDDGRVSDDVLDRLRRGAHVPDAAGERLARKGRDRDARLEPGRDAADVVGMRNRAIYGTRGAAACWEAEIARGPAIEFGRTQGRSAPSLLPTRFAVYASPSVVRCL